jgi:hypothetical protein
MPRKSRKKQAESPEGQPTLDEVVEKAGMKLASEIPAQLSPPEPELKPFPLSEQEPRPRELIEPTPEIARPRETGHRNGEDRELPKAELGEHTAAVLAKRPNFAPVPQGYRNVLRHEAAGIRVNKGATNPTLGMAAIQFAEDRPLSRSTEYDLMEAVQQAGFQFKPGSRQWERPLPEGMTRGENILEAEAIVKEIAAARDMGRGR